MISKAVLKLYKYGHYQNSISNYKAPSAYKIHRITKRWDETGANWTKATSSANWSKAGGDFDPAVIDSFNWDGKLNKDWFHWDVTKAIIAMVKNSESNFGFLILLTDKFPGSTDESTNNDSYFHSSEAADAALTPRLVVTGSPGTAVAAFSSGHRYFRVRCSHNVISAYLPAQTLYSVSVMDYLGRAVHKCNVQGASDWVRIPCGFTPGRYCITVQSAGMQETHGVLVY